MRAKFFSALALTLALAGMAHAQDADAGKTLTGKLEPAQATEMKADMQAYGGELRLKWIATPGTKVAAEEKVAELEAPELEEALAKARENLTAAEVGLQALQDSMAQYDASFPEQLAAAQRRHERAVEEANHWLKVEKDQVIRSAELGLKSTEENIADQKEELAQLQKLYDGNDLAKESQDIVLNRSKRRLEQSKERYEMAVVRHKRYVEVDLPRREEDMQAGVTAAKLELDRLKTQQERGNADMKVKLARAERGVSDARQAVEKLEKDAASLVLKAPHAGFVVNGGLGGNDGVAAPMKAGDKVGKGATLVAVVDASRLQLTVALQLADRAKFQPETAVNVSSTEQGVSAKGKVLAVGMLVRDGKVSARIEVDNAEGKLLPGAKATVALTQ
jgi:hypothetical protein